MDLLLRFRWFRVALTTDVSKMYRCIELVSSDRDFHRFVWRSDSALPLVDYRMTRLTFGVLPHVLPQTWLLSKTQLIML